MLFASLANPTSSICAPPSHPCWCLFCAAACATGCLVGFARTSASAFAWGASVFVSVCRPAAPPLVFFSGTFFYYVCLCFVLFCLHTSPSAPSLILSLPAAVCLGGGAHPSCSLHIAPRPIARHPFPHPNSPLLLLNHFPPAHSPPDLFPHHPALKNPALLRYSAQRALPTLKPHKKTQKKHHNHPHSRSQLHTHTHTQHTHTHTFALAAHHAPRHPQNTSTAPPTQIWSLLAAAAALIPCHATRSFWLLAPISEPHQHLSKTRTWILLPCPMLKSLPPAHHCHCPPNVLPQH